MFDSVKAGVAYYPERWGEDEWDKDIELMARSGVGIVRMGDFAWSRLEPEEGKFDTAWLEDVADKIAARGMKVILATPTNCPPLWLYRKYPEALQVDAAGNRVETGIRGHRCYTSPVLRKFAERIVEKLAAAFQGRDYVLAWQIDNEPDAAHCHCESCRKKFAERLYKKFDGNLKRMNREYGLDVWSGEFSDWSEIATPRGKEYLPDWLNPSFLLEYERFCSDTVAEFVGLQAEVIKRYIPAAVVTTNACIGTNTPDFYRLFAGLDVASYDNYPSLDRVEYPNPAQGLVLDYMRGIKEKNFFILEQMGGAFGCWGNISPAPRPGAIGGYAFQAVAHGADLVLFFRFRTSDAGAECFCHGLLDHDGAINRRYREFSDFCSELARANISTSARVKSRVALLCSFDNSYAFKLQRQSAKFSYERVLREWYLAYRRYGVNVDVISEDADFSRYDIVLAPALFVEKEGMAARAERFVQDGGTFILTARSGVKDENNACRREKLPNGFSRLCGATVEEYDGIGAGKVQAEVFGERGWAECWCDILSLTTANPVGSYQSEYYRGKACATMNEFGKGKCYYLGALFDEEIRETFAKITLEEKGVRHYDKLPRGIEISSRSVADREYIFVFNNSFSNGEAELFGTLLRLQPFGSKIIERKTT